MDELDKILKELDEKRKEYRKKYVRGKGLLQVQMEALNGLICFI